MTGLTRKATTFAIPSRDARRRAIVDTIHPALEDLAADLLEPLSERLGRPLHRSLPRLDWPRGYEPFCTWLALSWGRGAPSARVGRRDNRGGPRGQV